MLSSVTNTLYDAVVNVAARQHHNSLKRAAAKTPTANTAAMEKSTATAADDATLAPSSRSPSLKEKGVN
ncbi:hypothetical protein DRE_04615 [Drechslerella stenobrocha 248]|uniref:Uncharacterized protein n=1 Tax=Drechslerella stenobrocha 248 TaxID=1043628 RepID=W7HPK2_9PEZI|nr:hypothetical protein DRE_04615 [Drechslerella stenobrocha 248]